MKVLTFCLIILSKLLAAQLLTVNNLENLTQSPLHHLDRKLADHFSLKRNPALEDEDNRVYSNDHPNENFRVLTVFINAKNCPALSLVTHNEAEINHFQTDLIKEGFMVSEYRDHHGELFKKFVRDRFSVIIKKTDAPVPAHQVVWMCR